MSTMSTQASYMTNVVSMQKTLVDGPWAETENLIACWRNIMPLCVMDGAIWDGDVTTSRALPKSHDLLLPSKYWNKPHSLLSLKPSLAQRACAPDIGMSQLRQAAPQHNIPVVADLPSDDQIFQSGSPAPDLRSP